MSPSERMGELLPGLTPLVKYPPFPTSLPSKQGPVNPTGRPGTSPVGGSSEGARDTPPAVEECYRRATADIAEAPRL